MNGHETVSGQTETPAGEEPDGRLWGYRFSEEGVAEIVQGPYLQEALEKREKWLWLNFDLADERAYFAISSLPHLPRAALAMLFSPGERQHIDSFGNVVVGVVADYERVEPIDPKRIVKWQFIMAPHLFVTVRRVPGYTLHQVHLDIQSGRHFPDVLQLFAAILNEFASATLGMMHELSNRLDEMEVQFLDRKEVSAPEILGSIRRRLVRLRRLVQPQRGLLSHLLTDRHDWYDEDTVLDCQRVADRLDDLAEELDALRERAHSLQDEFNGREAEKTNRRLTILSVVSALLLPATLISGIFGMNLSSLPFQYAPDGFIVICGLMAVSVGGMLVILRRFGLI